jgi:hypothetical protein
VRRNDYWDVHRLFGYALTGRGIVALTVDAEREAGPLHR